MLTTTEHAQPPASASQHALPDPGEQVPTLSWPIVGIFTFAGGGTPFILVSDHYKDLVGYTFANQRLTEEMEERRRGEQRLREPSRQKGVEAVAFELLCEQFVRRLPLDPLGGDFETRPPPARPQHLPGLDGRSTLHLDLAEIELDDLPVATSVWGDRNVTPWREDVAYVRLDFPTTRAFVAIRMKPNTAGDTFALSIPAAWFPPQRTGCLR